MAGFDHAGIRPVFHGGPEVDFAAGARAWDKCRNLHSLRLPWRGHLNHGAKEYARGDVTIDSVEGFLSIFKRGMKGVYQDCDEKHLHRYLAEFGFRYNHRVKLGDAIQIQQKVISQFSNAV